MFASRAAFMTAGAAAPKGSVYFNGSARLSIADATPLNPESGDFTIEGWFYSTVTSLEIMYYKGAGLTGTTHAFVLVTSGNNLQFNGNTVISGSTAWTVNTWNHAAVARSGTSTKLFLNGVQQGSTMSDSTNYNTASPLTIGDRFASHPFGNYPFTGYISNFRMVKGTALYTSNFTPPTTPLTAISGTTLLTCQNPTTIVDNGPNAYTITNTSATADSLSPF